MAAQAICAGEPDYRVLAVAAASSRNGQAHIAIRVASTLIYVEDRAALESFLAAWRKAAELAERVFPPVRDGFYYAEQRERREFEKSSERP